MKAGVLAATVLMFSLSAVHSQESFAPLLTPTEFLVQVREQSAPPAVAAPAASAEPGGADTFDDIRGLIGAPILPAYFGYSADGLRKVAKIHGILADLLAEFGRVRNYSGVHRGLHEAAKNHAIVAVLLDFLSDRLTAILSRLEALPPREDERRERAALRQALLQAREAVLGAAAADRDIALGDRRLLERLESVTESFAFKAPEDMKEMQELEKAGEKAAVALMTAQIGLAAVSAPAAGQAAAGAVLEKGMAFEPAQRLLKAELARQDTVTMIVFGLENRLIAQRALEVASSEPLTWRVVWVQDISLLTSGQQAFYAAGDNAVVALSSAGRPQARLSSAAAQYKDQLLDAFLQAERAR